MNTYQLVLQFILSGSIVVGASLLSKYVDSKWAGLLVALPTMTLLSLFFISSNLSFITTQKYLLSALLFMIPSAIYLLSIYLLLGKVNFFINLLVSTIPFIFTVFFIQKFI